MEVKGYGGKIVHVDLSRGKIKEEPLKEGFARTFLGGKGFGAYMLYWEAADVSPLSPENLLIFAVGPLNATLIPAANRLGAFFKSPLTGIWGESYCGGHIGNQLKRAGIDMLILRGASRKPIYLLVDDGKVEIRDARHLWGRDSYETQDMLREELGRGFETAAIGPAGENLVKYACIDHAKGRQFGRCGVGAVMGSKRVKALAVHGSRMVEVADPETVNQLRKEVLAESKEKQQTLSNYGTTAIANLTNTAGVFPTRNWQEGSFEHFDNISPEIFRTQFFKRRKACANCPVACCQITEVASGPYAGTVVEGPEYETMYAFGALCYINKPDGLAKINEVCDRLGVDTMSAGNIVAFVMECFEKKILTAEDLGGLKVEFGDVEAVLELLPKIAYRRGVGMVLAEGVRRAAEIIGRGAERFAVHVKGLEPAGYDPRGLKGMALAYAVNCRGADHLRHMTYRPNLTGSHPFDPNQTVDRLSYEQQPAIVKVQEDFYVAVDSMILCHFLTLPTLGPILWERLAQAYSAVTGFEATPETLMEAACRIQDTVRLFNLKAGAPADMVFPERWLRNKLKRGASEGQIIHRSSLKRMLAEYYRLRGWNRKGKPRWKPPKLRE